MRDYVLLYVNGRRHEIRGDAAFASLTDFLRGHLHLTGTKVVCAEGDCGACTVLVGRREGETLRYLTVDACIQFLYQLDCRHVVTVEGLRRAGSVSDRRGHDAGHGTLAPPVADAPGSPLHPVQQALVDCHGSQCGYCTPGFVMALAGMVECQTERDAVRTSLTGNLCRCTGYSAILDAVEAIDVASSPRMNDLFPPATIADDLARHAAIPVRIATPAAVFFGPRTLDAALEFKANHSKAAIIAGGTELGVVRNKSGVEPAALLSVAAVPGLDNIVQTDDAVVIGSNVTWTQVEAFAKVAWPEFYRIVIRFGSPQIRNVATMIANIANGSPIADSLPFLFVADAELDVAGIGGTRRVKINDFYRGYKIKDLAPEEIITHVRIPRPAPGELFKLYKVSRRNDLDIATFGAAIRVRKVGEVIARADLAYSGVAATVVRLPRTEAFLQGKLFSEETFAAAGRLARSEVQPITDVRGSRDFRWRLAENIVAKFYFDCTS